MIKISEKYSPYVMEITISKAGITEYSSSTSAPRSSDQEDDVLYTCYEKEKFIIRNLDIINLCAGTILRFSSGVVLEIAVPLPEEDEESYFAKVVHKGALKAGESVEVLRPIEF